MRIPVCYGFARCNLFAVAFRHGRAVRDFIALFSTAKLIDHFQFDVTRGNNQFASGVGYRLGVGQFDSTFVLHLNAGFSCRTRCRTTDVERTHGQLCTRLTDGLCRDNTDRFTFVDDVTTCQVATVAVRTYAKIGFTANNGANLDGVDRVLFNHITPVLIQQRVTRNQDVSGARLQHVFCGHTTQYALAQRLFNVAAFDYRRHHDAFEGAAVVFGHNQILRNVNQTTRQITGVRGFQCGIRKTFTRTVGRDEVLEYVQTFTEVRGNRRLDDGAVRLRHQTTHTCQLTNLRRRTTRAGVSHHKDAVKGNLFLFFAVTVNHGFS